MDVDVDVEVEVGRLGKAVVGIGVGAQSARKMPTNRARNNFFTGIDYSLPVVREKIPRIEVHNRPGS